MLTLVLVGIFVFAAVSFVANFWWPNRRYYELLRKIPKIKGHLPIVGIAYMFIGADNEKIYDIMLELLKPGPVSPKGAWLGPMVFVLTVDDVDQANKVLSSKDCLDRPPFCKHTLMDHGILFASGNIWKTHRKMIDPAFNMNILRSFNPIFNDSAKLLVRNLNGYLGEEFDIYDVLSPIFIQSILLTTGIMKRPDPVISNEYLLHTRVLELMGPEKTAKFWYHWPPLLKYTEIYNIQQRSIYNGVVRMSELTLREREQQYLDGLHDEQKSVANKPQIFVDQLYKLRKQFTYDDIIQEVNTMVMGGFETTTNTTSMIILLTAFFPEVQRKIVDELERVFMSVDEEITDDHLGQLVYLDLVIKETLRFWPAIPVTMRSLSNDMQIGDYLVPQGTTVFVPIMHIHRDKKNFGDDADEFRPERFAKENLHKMNPNAYIPFSKTPRNCIGHRYAGIIMKSILCYFYRNFKVTTSMKLEDIKFEFVVACRSAQGYNVTLERRHFGN